MVDEARPESMVEEREKLSQIRKIASSIFTGDAYTRFMTVLQTKPDIAQHALQVCLARAQRLGSKITDEQLKVILKTISSSKSGGGRITIKRK